MPQKLDAEYFRAKKRTPRYRAWARKRQAERYANDPQFRQSRLLHAALRQALRIYFKGMRPRKISVLVGCEIEELIAHIEKQFRPGMSWANRASWHIDHVQPRTAFDLTDTEQQRKCFHYTNLQPLFPIENKKKGGRRCDISR